MSLNEAMQREHAWFLCVLHGDWMMGGLVCTDVRICLSCPCVHAQSVAGAYYFYPVNFHHITMMLYTVISMPLILLALISLLVLLLFISLLSIYVWHYVHPTGVKLFGLICEIYVIIDIDVIFPGLPHICL